MIRAICSGLLLMGALSACHTTKQACDPGIMCTMDFRSVSVQVRDASGGPVRLDSAYTLRKKTGQQIRHEHHPAADSYTVLDDGFQKTLANRQETFLFTGFRDGRKVVEEPFVISADCCHIGKVSGNSVVTIQE
jgi:hypothetical protein